MEIPGTVWRTYRAGRCFYLNHMALRRYSTKAVRKLYCDKKNYTAVAFRIGQPVILYQRKKENPMKDVVYPAIITDIRHNARKERTMAKVWRCNPQNLERREYEDALAQKKGVYKRINFLIPYTPERYKMILEWLWQVRYIFGELVYSFFPISENSDFATKPLLANLVSVDAEKAKKDAIKAVGFDSKLLNNGKDFKRGYKMIDYKELVKGKWAYLKEQKKRREEQRILEEKTSTKS